MSVKKKGPTTSGERGPNIESSMHAVVQVVALQQGMFGGTQPAWTGSGTIVHPSGIILTNCHVANPRAMGMSAPEANVLAIAITQSADVAPKISYIAEIITYSAELDLAVLRIVSTADGRKVSGLNLPFLPVGDSDALDLGDKLFIMGYPGIGGNTITFTTGAVSGFTSEEGIRSPRAWIKTDATIAGGNSGGTALNASGHLVGVPTQAAAGANISPVDARPVVDTNRDGRVDSRDNPMAIGGFINGIRPVNLAKPMLTKAGVSGTVSSSNAPAPSPASVPNEGKQPKAGGSKSGGGSAGEPSGVGGRGTGTGTTIVGQITDQRGNGIESALILALQAGVSVSEFVQRRSESQIAAQAETNRNGDFSLGPLRKGQNYSLLVIAQGYQDIAVDEALRISSSAPDQAEMQPIALPRD